MDRKIKILILEHDVNDIGLIEYELNKGGISYAGEIVQTELDFEKALTEFQPDIILSDFSLPAFDGIHAFQMKQKKAPHIPFIFVSGAIGEENSIELIKSGVTDYVLKDKLFTLTLKLTRALRESEEKAAKLEVERNLIKSEKSLAEAQAIAGIGNWEVDIATKVQTWSEELYTIFGVKRSECHASRDLFSSLVHEDDINRLNEIIELSFEQKTDASFNFRFYTKSGDLKHGHSQWKFEFSPDGIPLRQYGIVQDITERKKAEAEILIKNEQLRQLSTHLRNIREDERKHIAREIHDELGQHLTALKMDIDWVMHKQDGANQAVMSKLNDMLNLSDDIINTVRRISSELRPAIIDDLGLMAALEWKCNDFEEKTGTLCHFISSVKERKFDSDFGINVYRILQETLTNISRHAEAQSVSVKLSENGHELVMEINDDGKGVSDDHIHNGKTLGILGMKERASLLGGELVISGIKGKGTYTKLTLPFNYENTYSR